MGGKERYRPYDLRHVAISRWLGAGIPVAQAAQWAGNTSEVIWKHYAGTTRTIRCRCCDWLSTRARVSVSTASGFLMSDDQVSSAATALDG